MSQWKPTEIHKTKQRDNWTRTEKTFNKHHFFGPWKFQKDHKELLNTQWKFVDKKGTNLKASVFGGLCDPLKCTL